MNRQFFASMAAVLLISLVGCGGGSSNNGSGPLLKSTAVDKGAATIGAAGGKLATTSGNAVVILPANALASSTSLTAQSGGPSTANGQIVANTVYTFGPTGTQFAQPVTLTLKYDPVQIPAGGTESTLGIFYNAGSDWALVPGSTVDTTAKTVTAPISHFSQYAVLAINQYSSSGTAGTYTGSGPNSGTASGGFTITVSESGTLKVINSGGLAFSGAGTVSLTGTAHFGATGGSGTADGGITFSFTGAFTEKAPGTHATGTWSDSDNYSGTWEIGSTQNF